MSRWWMLHGKSEEVLRSMPDACIDSMVSDPPAGIDFMAKNWDSNLGSRDKWIAKMAGIFKEAWRVLKPGSHILVWAIPRTASWTATAIEDAGFEVRDRIHDVAAADVALMSFMDSLDEHQLDALLRIIEGQSSPVLYHLFLNGMPKYQNARRQLDMHHCTLPGVHCDKNLKKAGTGHDGEPHLCPPAEGAAFREGYATALKPTVEHWILARKPLSGTQAVNQLQYGTGAMNINGCRVAAPGETIEQHGKRGDAAQGHGVYGTWNAMERGQQPGQELGRWPRHVVLEHAPGCTDDACVPGCPVPSLDRETGDVDQARMFSRFHTEFHYSPKPSTREKDAGLGDVVGRQQDAPRGETSLGANNPRNRGGKKRKNSHPTVKGIELMRWLVRLVTPAGGICVDPFAGSATTGCAAVLEGMHFVGIEQDAEYVEIGRRRLAYWESVVLTGGDSSDTQVDTDDEGVEQELPRGDQQGRAPACEA